ncbi:methionine--tRNA ligase [Candidatus Dojkabacteria bacterium]|uniref:Methionine--tRNA ligase n=1 Tax=Candidatus Dojkabacteria bacterium TaxID=2099670 RepID=A0A955RKD5_9BACT|nr:methionine--tRNA ligase [Candidatus Dojkabacteria bacterium]
MNDSFYLTTTLPYVNGEPHIGHALEFIQADVIARYKRNKGFTTYFNTGTDEHGLKMYQKAGEENLSPQEYVDKYSQRFKDFCKSFSISYDRFIRTTDEDHIKAAQTFWNKSLENGDIYKKAYTGLYCVGCEEFKTEKDLVDGKCPDHNKEPEEHSEENYFFKFSRYQEPLLDLYKKQSDFVKPASKLQEMISFVGGGLQDFSISRRRENLPWGISVPNDPDQVMYVWFDALVNYVTTIGYGTNEKEFEKWWPVVQLCGPDNNRFQSAMWQAMLMSAGIKPSKHILIHGMILAEDGTKMSKTIGNVVSPFELLETYGAEATRYYLISGIPTFGDSSFSHDQLEMKYKADLQNNFGNLLNRVITMINKKEVDTSESLISESFKSEVLNLKARYTEHMDSFDLFEAMKNAQKLGSYGNVYITEQEPWAKDKTEEEITETLSGLEYLLNELIELYSPVLPDACEKAKSALLKRENIILFPELEIA